MPSLSAIVVTCLVLLPVVGCSQPVRVSRVASSADQLGALRRAFTAAGLSVSPGPSGSHGLFGTATRYVPLLVADENVQVYEFPSSRDASAAAATLDDGGSSITVYESGGGSSTTMIDWKGPPHFFRRDRLLVLYVGQAPRGTALDRRVLKVLSQQLGPQFAGVP